MNIILLEKVENLGELGDQVNVKPGYGRNYLIPGGKAVPATKDNITQFDGRRAELEAKVKTQVGEAEKRRDAINALSISLTANAGDEGKLFGSVSNAEIANAICDKGVNVEKREIRMPQGPIRVVGEYEFEVHLYTGVDATIKVTVEAE
ncbi:LSU ribosomal protein L9p [hydrothermal vent metagenome]|uniref:LSU ribosomal protein L9p n=1 Tax=hydrothermal vent metagenome TaxID=652676 RepID=A0A3B0YGU3_9ZZZZ